jgi:hypothetical protein
MGQLTVSIERYHGFLQKACPVLSMVFLKRFTIPAGKAAITNTLERNHNHRFSTGVPDAQDSTRR